jgi:hypothetical protein
MNFFIILVGIGVTAGEDIEGAFSPMCIELLGFISILSLRHKNRGGHWKEVQFVD